MIEKECTALSTRTSLNFVTGHWNRIRALSLKLGILFDSHIMALASSWIGSSQGFPSSLENLHIHRHHQYTPFTFLTTLLSQPLPESLKVVHLNRSPIPKHFSNLKRLKRLSLDSTVSASRLTCAQILEILRSSPDLEVLHLRTVVTHTGTSSIKPVSLPCLRHLSLRFCSDVPNEGTQVLLDQLDISPDVCPSDPHNSLTFATSLGLYVKLASLRMFYLNAKWRC
ncbi:hypothetical protein BD410DRAFT_509238 [Rickenella mellea]|uniref:F-box domain-containing protein n=1 Tax=Rickenella mellea TaxID=50990 RepID=A0A4Y7PSQ3_9AGAM|nr:hypothetical protein BD410DRAFT_509238 [Rickenella mellea]